MASFVELDLLPILAATRDFSVTLRAPNDTACWVGCLLLNFISFLMPSVMSAYSDVPRLGSLGAYYTMYCVSAQVTESVGD